jgi:hypothetical protein
VCAKRASTCHAAKLKKHMLPAIELSFSPWCCTTKSYLPPISLHYCHHSPYSCYTPPLSSCITFIIHRDLPESLIILTSLTHPISLPPLTASPSKLRTTIERLVAENHFKEEHLLVLEGARIDIKSALEKASLKKARKRSLPLGTGSLSSGEMHCLVSHHIREKDAIVLIEEY